MTYFGSEMTERLAGESHCPTCGESLPPHDDDCECACDRPSLVLPVTKPEPEPEPSPEITEDTRDGFPVKAGWTYSKCGERYIQSTEEVFRMKALEDLYTAVGCGGGIKLGKQPKDQKRCEQLLNELAVELVGGIPESWEEYT